MLAALLPRVRLGFLLQHDMFRMLLLVLLEDFKFLPKSPFYSACVYSVKFAI